MGTKRNLSALAEAGVNIIAKLKKKSKDVIIPQSYTYTEGQANQDTVNEDVRNIVRNMGQVEDREPLAEEPENVVEKQSKEAKLQFKNIEEKFEFIKKKLADVISANESKRTELANSGLKREDLQKELDKTAQEIDSKLSAIKDMMDKTGDVIIAFDESTRTSYQEITESLKAVSEDGKKNAEKLETLKGTLSSAEKKVKEIHETTSSIDKLYDSVFELKTANIENKNSLEKALKSVKTYFILTLIFGCILSAVSITGLVFAILAFIK